MRKFMQWQYLILWLCVFMMAGCVSGGRGRSVGRMIDTTHVNDIQEGQSKEQIQAWFGKPYATGFSDENDDQGRPVNESWVYTYGWSNLSSSKSQALSIIF
jgi:ribulose bisphosphate carboxylase small subunit